MYRISVQQGDLGVRGRWLHFADTDDISDYNYSLQRAIEKCEIIAYKVELID